MKNIKKLDELQLLKRGNIFKHGLFLLIGLLLFNAFLYSYGIKWTSGKWDELTIVLFVIVWCSLEFIIYDIYPFSEKRQKYLIYFCGLFGVVALIACIYDLTIGNVAVLIDGKITESALGVVYSLMFIAIWIIYIIKTKYNAMHENDE